jgi:hypothetical protein
MGLARRLLANWNEIGSGATVDDEVYAQKKLQEVLRNLVKDPYADYKTNILFLGHVSDFFPRAANGMGLISVFWNPLIRGCAARLVHNVRHGYIEVGKWGFKHKGSGRSLGGSFIHEVEHLHDLLIDKKYEMKDQQAHLSEFTPRLRQMLRHLKDEPNFRIWNYFHRKLGELHAENYVDRYLEGVESYTPTEEERKFATQAVMKRAKEIYDNMVSQNLI